MLPIRPRVLSVGWQDGRRLFGKEAFLAGSGQLHSLEHPGIEERVFRGVRPFGVVQFVVGRVYQVQKFLLGKVPELEHQHSHLNPVLTEHRHSQSSVALVLGNERTVQRAYLYSKVPSRITLSSSANSNFIVSAPF